ncbi:MAG: hypothetical protein ACXWKG_15480 [Limisphaerales bacterium]
MRLPRVSVWFLAVAWIAFVVSFFLPVTKGMFAITSGWGAAQMCAEILIRPLQGSSGDGLLPRLGGWLYYGFFTVANLIMVISPILWIYSWRKQNPMLWLRITSIAMVLYVVSVDVFLHDDSGFGSGYFLWVISFILLAGAVHVNAKEIAGCVGPKHVAGMATL